jgi:hypothetical protein
MEGVNSYNQPSVRRRFNMQPIIDADTHVAESEAMWKLFADHCRQNFFPTGFEC